MAGQSQDLLTLTQWMSPAFPIGAFAYSHGLETAVADGSVSSPAVLQDWLTQVLKRGSGISDAVLLARALEPGADLDVLADEARARAGSRERWVETFEQGRAFTETVNALTGRSDPAVALPVAVGRVGQTLSLPAADVISVFLQAFASNLVSAAIRLIPIGQTDGQTVLHALNPIIGEVALRAIDTPLADVRIATFGAEVAAMRHETQDIRLFKT